MTQNYMSAHNPQTPSNAQIQILQNVVDNDPHNNVNIRLNKDVTSPGVQHSLTTHQSERIFKSHFESGPGHSSNAPVLVSGTNPLSGAGSTKGMQLTASLSKKSSVEKINGERSLAF